MRGLATYIMRGPVYAMLVTAVFAILTPVLPPLVIISGAALTLATLRMGVKSGLMVGIGATLITMVFFVLLSGNGLPALNISIVVFLPLFILALIYRNSISLNRTLTVLAVLAGSMSLMVYMSLGDPGAWWSKVVETNILPALEEREIDLQSPDGRQVMLILAWFGQVVIGLSIYFYTMILAGSLLLARWWQSGLYNPGGYRDEFYNLRFGRIFAIAMIVALGISFFEAGDLGNMALNVAIAAMFVFMLQGIALMHSIVASRGMNILWLVILYILILFALLQMTILLTVIALVDSGLDIRRRLSSQSS
ncbi:MAG: hypothetical protein BMS9Abin26_1874 [Gammaproteobacteria bacterium]|nr:MAG: hypothetical protein BMS9Abin26_1874 [Gammaproteobacteria bacterium]